ncbi:biotin transporter BioY [Paenibacillus oenotherae]|uniref:Biotin transporter n=1 Tax=Paenibacillus oenotherae TaxID=1435645 RepID=A0ABS7CZV0_9BACL|nr:biotin transporter BioY [Paenibacillus oenotherae]MBW7473155.1 biotin transporter BioY [Paenibacillus oenotherae]
MKTDLSMRGLVFSALFAALLVASSYVNIHLGFSPVPITIENLVVMLAGAILGPLYGFISISLVVVLAALGIPMLHGSGGAALLLGPTGGFVWAYPFAALLIGLIVQRIKGRSPLSIVLIWLAMELFGSLLLYVSGVPWLAHAANLTWQKALALGCYPYLAGDAIKAAIATAILLPIRNAFPVARIIGARPSQK